jgi:hypothetical protein
MSEGKIYGAISNILNEIDAIGKDRKNESQNFWFRGIDQVYAAIHPLLAKYRVFPTCKVLGQHREEKQTKAGGTMAYTLLTLEYTFWAEDGSSVSTQVVGEGMDSGDKSSNKSLSSGYKYALFQMLCIPTVAVDPDYETHELQSNREPRFQTPPPSQRPQSQPQQSQYQPPPQNAPQQQAPQQQPQGGGGKFVNLVCPYCGVEAVGKSSYDTPKNSGLFGGYCYPKSGGCKAQFTPGQFEELQRGTSQQQQPPPQQPQQQYFPPQQAAPQQQPQYQQPAPQQSSQVPENGYHEGTNIPKDSTFVPF